MGGGCGEWIGVGVVFCIVVWGANIIAECVVVWVFVDVVGYFAGTKVIVVSTGSDVESVVYRAI